MKNLYLYFVLSIIFITNGFAQPYQKTEMGAKVVAKSIKIEIQFYSPSTVRVLKWPEGKTFTKESFSVIKTPQKTDITIQQQGEGLLLKSEKLQVQVNLKNGKVSFSNTKSENLLSEKDGSATFIDFDDAGSKTYTIKQSFALDKDEAIYGLASNSRAKWSNVT